MDTWEDLPGHRRRPRRCPRCLTFEVTGGPAPTLPTEGLPRAVPLTEGLCFTHPKRATVGTNMTGAEKDTLIALVEQGPLWDGDVPSKVGRDALIAQARQRYWHYFRRETRGTKTRGSRICASSAPRSLTGPRIAGGHHGMVLSRVAWFCPNAQVKRPAPL